MTAHYGRCRLAFRGLAIVFVLPLAIFSAQARADAPPPKEITVNVDPGKSYQGNVGAGFNLVEQEATELKINLNSSEGTITKSELVSCAPGANWSKIDETHWHCTGIGPNDKFWCVIKCTLTYPPGGTGDPIRWMSVSDVDFDADSNNNADPFSHRPPSRSQDEDYNEYPGVLSTDPIGLVIPIDDDNQVNTTWRDGGLSAMNYDTDLDVLNAVLEIHPKKAGVWNEAFPGVTRYTEDGTSLFGANKHLDQDQSTPINLRLKSPSDTASGTKNSGLVVFMPDAPSAGYDWSRDAMKYIFLGCDIDVDSDNDGTVATSNQDGTGEDFFEALPSDCGQYVLHPEYKYGMIVAVNDGDANGDGNPDNGWNGTDWSGPNGNTVEDAQNLRPGVLRGLGVSSGADKTSLEQHQPVLRIKKVSGDGAVRLFTAADPKTPIGVFASNGDAVDEFGGQSNWQRLYNTSVNILVEGLRPGEVMLAYQLVLNNVLIHQDVVRITVVGLQLEEIKGLYKEDGSYQAGYVSGDDKGRIYCNAAYDTNDVSKVVWAKKKQFVDLKVKTIPDGVPLPTSARVVWTSEDPDDPSVKDAAVSAGAKHILHPNHYDSSGTQIQTGNDNTGDRDGASEWEEIHADYALGGNETKIKDGISKVRFNAKDHGGDNSIIKPQLKVLSGAAPSGGVKTGVMTIWKRVLVQKGIMADVPAGKQINNAEVMGRFKIAFVEMVFGHQDAPEIATTKVDPMGANNTAANTALHDYCKKPPVGQFQAEAPGTMFLVAAHNKTAAGTSIPEVLFPRPTKVGDAAGQSKDWGFAKSYVAGHDGATRYAKLSKPAADIVVEIYESKPGGVLTNKLAEGSVVAGTGDQLVRFTEIGGSGCNGSVVVNYTADNNQIELTLHLKGEATLKDGYEMIPGKPRWPKYVFDYNLKSVSDIKPASIVIYKDATSAQYIWSRVEAGGAIPADEVVPDAFDYAVADPNDIGWKTLIDYGFVLDTSQWITVYSPGAVYRAGTADSVTVTGETKFKGQCMIWTAPQSAAGISGTVAHEFTHCLGIAHNCGYKDYKDDKPCAMTYSNHFLRSDADVLAPWSNASEGSVLCAPHIKIIRETQLEDEGPGLKLDW